MPNKVANIVGSGYPAQAAGYISGQAIDGLVALGTTQLTALPVFNDTNVVITVAASTGVVFSGPTSPGDEFVISNMGANTLAIYPAFGESINNLATNAPFSLATLKNCYFVKGSNTRWVSILSA